MEAPARITNGAIVGGVLLLAAIGAGLWWIVRPAPDPARLPAAVARPEHGAPNAPAKTAEIVVDAIGGRAEVFSGGVAIGATPYRTELPVGSQVSLELRREGAVPQPVQFEVRPTDNRYAIVLRSAP